jgi:hypothetical protein
MATSGSGPPHYPDFTITHNDAPQSVGLHRQVIGPSQRPLPENTQFAQRQTDRQTPTSPAGFQPTISASKRSPIHALDRAATATKQRTPLIFQLKSVD